MNLRHIGVALLAAAAVGLSVSRPAFADGGNYSFDGGTPFEQLQVEKALNASAFDWNMVRGPVTINIKPGIADSHSLPGQIWLDANVLDTGEFSWGVVQMEYAQQVQLSLVTDASLRAQLTSLLGAQQWCYDDPSRPKGANACERFAATLAWAYWPVPQNCMQPAGKDDWSASMDPVAFREMLEAAIGAPNSLPDAQPGVPARVLSASHPAAKTVHRADGSQLLSLRTPGAGTVTVSGTGLVAASVAVSASSVASVWLRPSTPLAAGATRNVHATVTFAPANGGAAFSVVEPVTFSR